MSIWDRTKCFMGFHDFYVTYDSDGHCSGIERCHRDECHVEERGVFHPWANWDYLETASCRRARECARCHSVEVLDGEHDWERFDLTGALETLTRKCVRCGEVDRNPYRHHRFGEPTFDSHCQRFHKCGCGETLNTGLHHKYRLVDPASAQYKCDRCKDVITQRA